MLRVNNIEVMYQGVILVLRGTSLDVPDGAITALLGANGGGKTTLLKAISGLLHIEDGEVTRGSIEFDGKRIDKARIENIVQSGITQVMEGRRVAEHLTVEENLKSGGHLRKRSEISSALDMVYQYFPKLKDLRLTTSGYLSGGEQQMLVMGRAMMSNPKLMLLDEPSIGLSPILVQEIVKIVERMNKERNMGVLLVEQNVKAALDIASYGYVMESGRIVLDGSADNLKNNEDVREFYMGLSEVGQKRSYRDVKHYKRRKRWLG